MRGASRTLSAFALGCLASACGIEHPAVYPGALDANVGVTDAPPPPDSVKGPLDAGSRDIPAPPPVDVTSFDAGPPDAGAPADIVEVTAPRDVPGMDTPVPPVDVPVPPVDVPVPPVDVPQPPVDVQRPDVVVPPVDVGPPDTGAPPSGVSCEDAIVIPVVVGRQERPGDTTRMAPGRYAASCNATTSNSPEVV
jgi:hypothetical protein